MDGVDTELPTSSDIPISGEFGLDSSFATLIVVLLVLEDGTEFVEVDGRDAPSSKSRK